MIIEMNPETIGKIREIISEKEMSEAHIVTVLYTSIMCPKMPQDAKDRARIVSALGYDPEDRWK